MSSVYGSTSNGCTFEGERQPEIAGRVLWTATFRDNGSYAGMRHGCVHAMQGVSEADVDSAVKADIEFIWTGSH